MLPNFLVIGAPRAGTTSLWSYLKEHPQIFMSARKELDFFSDPGWTYRTDWYRRQFADAVEPLRGEASVAYSMNPFHPGVPERIHTLLPEVKIIYLIRDPIPRAISYYVKGLAVGSENRPINEVFAEITPAHQYICPSRYASQLRAYLEFFPLEHFFIADHSELRDDRAATLERIFRFLDVDPRFRPEAIDRMKNTRESEMRATRAGAHLRTTPAARAIRRMPAPIARPAAAAARRLFYRNVERHPQLLPEVQRRLAAHLRPEVTEFTELTGLSYPKWSV